MCKWEQTKKIKQYVGKCLCYSFWFGLFWANITGSSNAWYFMKASNTAAKPTNGCDCITAMSPPPLLSLHLLMGLVEFKQTSHRRLWLVTITHTHSAEHKHCVQAFMSNKTNFRYVWKSWKKNEALVKGEMEVVESLFIHVKLCAIFRKIV